MKTKIICTIGPNSNSPEVLTKLINSGMSVARINCSHGTVEANRENIERVKRMREETQRAVSIMLDTKGPDIRIGKFAEGEIELVDGQTFTLCTREIVGDVNQVFIACKKLPRLVQPGQVVLLNNGMLKMKVTSVTDTEIICRVIMGGKLSDRKSLFVPGCDLKLPFISKEDKADLLMACETDVDWIAASFVGSAKDISEIKKFLNQNGKDIPIISKIESRRGVENIDEILKATDGIMIARGDLGVEYDFEHIPALQKMLISKARAAGKIVITATEMLESMIKNPRPTRAETTDVANAIYDGTSCIMLSGETAIGKYPVKVVEVMKCIATQTEKNIDYTVPRFVVAAQNIKDAFARTITSAAVTSRAKAICAFSRSGATVFSVAKFYPPCTIYGFASSSKIYNRFAMINGVVPVLLENVLTTPEMLEYSDSYVVKNKAANKGDIIIVNARFQDSNTDLVLMHPLGSTPPVMAENN